MQSTSPNFIRNCMHRSQCARLQHRALSLVELLLALGITAMVSMAIAGMLGAVSTGVGSRRDARSVMIRAHAAAARLAAYIAPSRCILSVNGSNVALWFNDSRQSETVHASEIRWLDFDAIDGTLDVHFVVCPDGWGKAACNLDDHTYPSNADWANVLATYRGKGMIASRTIVDGLASVNVHTEHANAMLCAFISFNLGFETESEVIMITTAAALAEYATPIN